MSNSAKMFTYTSWPLLAGIGLLLLYWTTWGMSAVATNAVVDYCSRNAGDCSDNQIQSVEWLNPVSKEYHIEVRNGPAYEFAVFVNILGGHELIVDASPLDANR